MDGHRALVIMPSVPSSESEQRDEVAVADFVKAVGGGEEDFLIGGDLDVSERLGSVRVGRLHDQGAGWRDGFQQEQAERDGCGCRGQTDERGGCEKLVPPWFWRAFEAGHAHHVIDEAGTGLVGGCLVEQLPNRIGFPSVVW
jgi:hypothetical protein